LTHTICHLMLYSMILSQDSFFTHTLKHPRPPPTPHPRPHPPRDYRVYQGPENTSKSLIQTTLLGSALNINFSGFYLGWIIAQQFDSITDVIYSCCKVHWCLHVDLSVSPCGQVIFAFLIIFVFCLHFTYCSLVACEK
jgi:hypothetical protein